MTPHQPLAPLRREHALEPREAAIVQLAPSLCRDRHPEMVCAFGVALIGESIRSAARELRSDAGRAGTAEVRPLPLGTVP